MAEREKVVLAYSGGLDTSVAIKWIEDTYGLDVITLTVEMGAQKDLGAARDRALRLGAVEALMFDARDIFVKYFVWPALQAGAIYEGVYPLATALGRPLIAKLLVDTARQHDAKAVAHGCTGKGNDQVRFELSAYALNPDIQVIAPWREWDLTSREKLVAYAGEHGIPVETRADGASAYSMDANMLHISYEGGDLENPWLTPDESMWRWTVSPQQAPAEPEIIEIDFAAGDAVAINGESLSPARLLLRLNKLGGRHGIGRADLVENRYVGMKSRGCYETPGGAILLKAHRAIESITLDREAAHLKDEMMPRYASFIYNGYWFAPERRMLQQMIDASQTVVNGTVRLELYKGNVIVHGRRSVSDSLFDESIATFEDDRGAYNQGDAEGFIKLNALRLRIAGRKGRD